MFNTRRRRKSVPNYTPMLNGQPMDRVHQYKYLGVVLTDDLTWTTHISEIANKARRIIGFIYRQFYSMSSTTALLQLYASLIRPHLEYAVQVWDPFLSKNIQKLELVQKFALKMCCKSWNSTYSEILQQSSLPTLSFRRKYLCLSYFYNLVNGHFAFPDVPATLYQNPYNTRSSHSSIYVQPYAHSNSFFNSYFPKTISLWNSLPTNVMASTSISSFKRNLLSCSHLI